MWPYLVVQEANEYTEDTGEKNGHRRCSGNCCPGPVKIGNERVYKDPVCDNTSQANRLETETGGDNYGVIAQ